MSQPIKRFIAGATCPSCQQMDKLQAYTLDGSQYRECVRCGYSDKLDQRGNISELGTRVNKLRAGEKPLPHEQGIQVLQLHPTVPDKRN